jgi:hypothetical protein
MCRVRLQYCALVKKKRNNQHVCVCEHTMVYRHRHVDVCGVYIPHLLYLLQFFFTGEDFVLPKL